MPVAIAVMIGVVVIATALIGLLWAMLLLLPYYVYVALAAYFIWRANRRHADLSAAIAREAERQRRFNEQEMFAWNRFLEQERREAARREKILRRFDNTRDPPSPKPS